MGCWKDRGWWDPRGRGLDLRSLDGAGCVLGVVYAASGTRSLEMRETENSEGRTFPHMDVLAEEEA